VGRGIKTKAELMGIEISDDEMAEIKRYLKEGITKVSTADSKKYGAAGTKELEGYAKLNRDLKEAKSKAKKVPGLEKKVTALEKQKTTAHNNLSKKEADYTQKVKDLKQGYEEAVFIKAGLEKLDKLKEKDYERLLKNSDELIKYGKTTHFKGKPTKVTRHLYDTLCFFIVRDEIKKDQKDFRDKIKKILRGEDIKKSESKKK